MSPSAYIGIDPGAGGAIALMTMAPKYDIAVLDMPVHEINGKRRIDLHALVRLLREWREGAHAIVENVGAMPGQAPNAMFSFGFAAGAVQTAVVAAEIPFTLVTPQTWKKSYGLPGGRENKDVSRQKASMMFPSHAHLWARKKDNDRAEAVLLAHYGSKLA